MLIPNQFYEGSHERLRGINTARICKFTPRDNLGSLVNLMCMSKEIRVTRKTQRLDFKKDGSLMEEFMIISLSRLSSSINSINFSMRRLLHTPSTELRVILHNTSILKSVSKYGHLNILIKKKQFRLLHSLVNALHDPS